MLAGKRILIVIGGGIAAYKVLEVIRRLKERGAEVRVILTRSGKEFVTPMTVGALSGEKVFSDLFDPTEEQDIGHIVLSRDTDLILVAPATANLMARMANGIADELATASLLAAAAPIIVCPAMNQRTKARPCCTAARGHAHTAHRTLNQSQRRQATSSLKCDEHHAQKNKSGG